MKKIIINKNIKTYKIIYVRLNLKNKNMGNIVAWIMMYLFIAIVIGLFIRMSYYLVSSFYESYYNDGYTMLTNKPPPYNFD